MDRNLSIILGVIIIYAVSFLLISVFSTLYFMISKRVKITFGKNLIYSSVLATVNLFATLLSIALFASNIYLFGIMSFLVIAGGYYASYRFLWKFNNIDALILSAGMAFILNPVWLNFLGII